MSATPFPTRADQITAPWLTNKLREQGLLASARVAAVQVHTMPDPGQTAEIYRITLDYEGEQEDAPRSLVVKMPASFAGALEVANEYDLYRNEVGFYRELAAERGLPVPRAYAAELDEASGDFVLVLEDLGAGRRGSMFRSSVADVKLALSHLARIHAEFWNDPTLERLEFVRKFDEPVWNAKLKGIAGQLVAAAHAHFTEQLSPSALAATETWLRLWDDMVGYNPDPRTLAHTDAHPQQMFFPTEQSPHFALFDWQCANYNWGAQDVARVLVTSLSVDDRRAHEHALVGHYHAELCQHGVTGFDKQRLWLQIAVSHMWNFYINAVGVLQTDTNILAAIAEAEGGDWRACWLGRVGTAMDDWGVEAALESFAAEARAARALAEARTHGYADAHVAA